MDSAWTERGGPARGRAARADRVTRSRAVRGRHGSAGRIRSAAQPGSGHRAGPADSGVAMVRKHWVRFGGLAVAVIVAAAFATDALASGTGQHHAQPPAGAAGARSGQGAAAGRGGTGQASYQPGRC